MDFEFHRHQTARAVKTTYKLSTAPKGVYVRWVSMVLIGLTAIVVGAIWNQQTTVRLPGTEVEQRPSEQRFTPYAKELQPRPNTATATLPDIPKVKKAEPKKTIVGHYWEAVRVQGDAYSSEEFERVKRLCIPEFQMPEVCYLPQEQRDKIMVRPQTK